MDRLSQSIIATSFVIAIATSFVIAAAALTFPAAAKPKVKEIWKTYSVDATTVPGLLKQMQARGPQNFWAYTEWYVNWTAGCKVSVKVTYTMPKHKKPGSMPKDVRARWDRMITALEAHEKVHGAHGIAAGNEVEAAKCQETDPIFSKYNRLDKEFDRRTNHGKKEGVVLK